MLVAKQRASNEVDVELFYVKHNSEIVTMPPEFNQARNIEKYAWEYIDALSGIVPQKPLPRIKDIIFSLYDSSNADFFIYTNLDIGLRPDFYKFVKELIDGGYDAFCINRRTLPKEHNGKLLDESTYNLILKIKGSRHPGTDCFVFKREIVPSLNLGNTYIGYPPIGRVLRTQIRKNSKRFRWVKDKKLTFHIGDDRIWNNINNPYYEQNMIEARGLYVNQNKFLKKMENRVRKLRNRSRSIFRKYSSLILKLNTEVQKHP